MTETLVLPAPAKLNLFLHIVGRRPDGYHLLQTVFQLIDLCDLLHLEDRVDGRIERAAGAPGVPAEHDLCVRAARLLQPLAKPGAGVTITLEKRIPMGGGLGGGSSNAATVLLGLNRLWSLGLDLDGLAALGLQLGADVPVFVRGRSAWAEGVGERLHPLALGEGAYLVVDSGVSVPTADLFQAPELTRDAPPATIAGFLSGAIGGNAFEPVLAARSYEVDEALRALRRAGGCAASQVALSGTGGCCFARFASRVQAEAAQQRLGPRWRSWVCRGLDVSPLLQAL
ncbi:MAG: 4-(cytidine 5'-diphospho)-2-C-methyl-D-erythritol kinase [Lysobacterales bacterium]